MLNVCKVEIVPLQGVFAWFCFKDSNRTPVGFAIVDPVYRNADTAIVRYIHVVSEFRNAGIGKLLTRKIKEEFKCLLVERIPDDEMKAFYEKQGFEITANNTMMWTREVYPYHKDLKDLK